MSEPTNGGNQAPEPDQPQYGQQPGQPQYGQPGQQPGQPQYGQQPGQPQYGQPGQQYPAYGQQSYATGPPTEANSSAIVLTILSGITMLSTCFIIGIPGLVFGIMALTSNSTDPVASRKKAKTGWIALAINVGAVVAIGVLLVIGLVATGRSSYSGY